MEVRLQFRDRILAGLQRKSIQTCSDWATTYRIMGGDFPGPYSFRYHPWNKQIHDDPADITVGRKAAQMGFTEVALNRCFYCIDMLSRSVLYVLPSATPDASVFSADRFDSALELSPHLNKLFSDVKNIGHKRAGSTSLYIRGSRSRAQLKSIPVGAVIFDEVDEMVQKNIPLAIERMSGHIEKIQMYVSTPTIAHFGIDELYEKSTQNHYVFRCPRCSRYTELLPECLIVTAENIHDPKIKDSHYICKECKNILPSKSEYITLDNCKWVPSYPDRDISGYWISQLYSPTISPETLATHVIAARSDPVVEQELYNSKYGVPHIVANAKLSINEVKTCVADYEMGPTGGLCTMGVDVGGRFLHVNIDRWKFEGPTDNDINLSAYVQTIYVGEVTDFHELDPLIRKYDVKFTCVDANPERRAALEFAQRWWGNVKLVYYDSNIMGKQINEKADEEHLISANRTSWLDLTLGRYRKNKIALPKDTPEDYFSHVAALTRIYKRDKDGNPISIYVNGNLADHYAHARNYSEIAFKHYAGYASSSIGKF